MLHICRQTINKATGRRFMAKVGGKAMDRRHFLWKTKLCRRMNRARNLTHPRQIFPWWQSTREWYMFNGSFYLADKMIILHFHNSLFLENFENWKPWVCIRPSSGVTERYYKASNNHSSLWNVYHTWIDDRDVFQFPKQSIRSYSIKKDWERCSRIRYNIKKCPETIDKKKGK